MEPRFAVARKKDEESGGAQAARKCVAEVRMRLLAPAPGALEACAAPLKRAIGCLERLQTELREAGRDGRAASQGLRDEIEGLRSDLIQVNALLRAAGDFYEGYGRLLSAQEAPPAGEARQFVIHG